MFYPICLVYTFTNYSSKICLEDNTERSESNPGRSLGIYDAERDDCLEDSTKTYKDIEMTKRIINKVLSSRQLLISCP